MFNKTKSRIKKWLIVLGLKGAVIIAVIMIIVIIFSWVFNMLNNLFEFELYGGDITQKEQQQFDKSVEMLAQRSSDTSFYQMLSPIGSYNQSWLDKTFDQLDYKTQELINNNIKYTRDANGEKTFLKPAKAFDVTDSKIDEYYRSADGAEQQYIFSPEALIVLNQELNDEGIFNGNTKVFYYEAFTKPVAFVYDYLRVDELNNDFIYIKERSEDGIIINQDKLENSRVYDFEYEYNNIEYFKETDNIHLQIPKSAELGDKEENKFGNEAESLKRRYFETDNEGNPIITEGELEPRKYLQLVELTDKDGKVNIQSLVKYNTSTKREKRAIITEDDEIEIERRIDEYFEQNPVNSYEGDYYSDYQVKKDNIRNEYEQEKLEGKEGEDWYWEYDGKVEFLGDSQKDGSLNYNANKEDFRYIAEKDASGKIHIIDRALEDPKYEFKNLAYAWSDEAISPNGERGALVSKETGEPIPMEIESVRDYGLGVIFSYFEARSVKFNQSLAMDEERDSKKVEEYIVNNYSEAFQEAEDGYYPKFIELEDEKLKEYSYNTEELNYFNDMSDKHGKLGQTNPLLTEETIGTNGEFLGIGEFNNHEINNKIQVKAPYIKKGLFNFLSDISKKNQVLNPEKYYLYWFDKINQDNRTLEYWMPEVASIAEKVNEFVNKDEKVNANIDLEKYSYNEKLEDKREELAERGEYYLTQPSWTERMYLLDTALTFAGRFMETYVEEVRVDRPLSDLEEQAVIDLYEYDRHWLAKSWTTTLEIEEKTYSRESEVIEHEDGSISINYYWEAKYDTRYIDVSNNVDGDVSPDLVFYQSHIPGLTYKESDSGKVIAENGFDKDQEFKPNTDIATYELKVPKVKDSIVGRYTYERGESKSSSYKRSRVTGVEYELDIEDNRNKGEIGNLYRRYEGAIYEVRPFPNETYFNEERLSDWRNRMTVTNEHTSLEARRIKDEENNTIKYLYDFIKNYEKDIPLQVLQDEYVFEQTEDYYWDAVQTQDHSKEVSKELEGYRNTVLSVLSSSEWKKAFDKMNLNQKYDQYMVSDIILGVIEEEKLLDNPNTEGFANIYFPQENSSIDANEFWINGKESRTYKLDKEDIENPYKSISYVTASLRNLILRYDGDILKAVFAYHIGPETLDELVDRNPDTFTHRSKEEILNIANSYWRGRNFEDINPRFVEDVLSYVDANEAKQKLANTNTKWYEELWDKIKTSTKSIVSAGDLLLERISNGLYTSMENKGIIHIKNHKSDDEVKWTLLRMLSLKKKVPIDEITWEVFDFFGKGSSTVLSTSKSPNLEYFRDLIYNIDDYVTPYSDPDVRISSSWGWRIHPILKTKKYHTGIDLAKPTGEPIQAIADGEVISSGWRGGYGYAVYIKHPIEEGNTKDYIISLYAHMVRQPMVRVGEQVKAGQLIGETGNSGMSKGAHLHFEMRGYISKENKNYDKWMEIIDLNHNNSFNPFWFSKANPTPEDIEKNIKE
ncbi:peptidoglycan DD-metalloendopeptidase family protein [Brassicibacter mesophilus]|uniref:M23 family metallopeptidase n=1 Tax=Brassicibacter mesophilus TaxID=745119 RepID=UPI003D1E67A2